MHQRFRYYQQLTSCLLALMIFASLAPSISAWLARVEGITRIELCSAGNSRVVTINLAGKLPPAISAVSDNHCGYCLLLQHTPVIPSLTLSIPLAPALLARISIGSGSTTIFKRFIQTAYQTRAPPAV